MRTKLLSAKEVLPACNALLAVLEHGVTLSLIADNHVEDEEGNEIFSTLIPLRSEKGKLLGLVDCQWIPLRLDSAWTYTIDMR